MKSDKLVYVQSLLLQSELDKLKEKAGTDVTKDAVSVAIEAYIKGN